MNNKIKYLLAFSIPLIFLILLFIIKDIILGRYTILYGDSQYQYYQLLLYLKDVLNGNSSFFYSFQMGFGSPMLATIAYYLISPFNLLVILFSNNNMEILFTILVFVKISLCGLTMYHYLQYHFKNKYNILFSTTYALSFFVVANYYQIMWLDTYFLAPLLLLGIDKIIKEDKFILYFITLFLIILTNYYNGFMCCIFSVLYFIYKYLLNNKKDYNKIKTFIIISSLAGLMTMFLNLPNFLEIINIDRNSDKSYIFNNHFGEVISKMFLGSHSSKGIMNEFSPFLYIGIFNIILLFFYFVNKKIEKKEKILSLSFIIILTLSIWIVPLNNMWHAFSNPIGFNFRYIFLFNILFITFGVKSLINISYVDKIWYYVMACIFLIIMNIMIWGNYISIIYVALNVILFIIYILIFKIKNHDTELLFFILATAELFFNSYTILSCYQFTYRQQFNGRYEEKKQILDSIDDNTFYRVEFEKKVAFNDSLHYGYNGVTGWLSSAGVNMDFYNKIGYYSDNNTIFYNHFILLDSLFNIKYYNAVNENKYYNLIDTESISVLDDMLYGKSYMNSYTYENPYALSLGYMVSSDIKNNFNCQNGFDCQNKIVKLMTGEDYDIYIFEEIKDEIVIKNENDFYVLIKDKNFLDKTYKVCIEKYNCFDFMPTTNRSMYIYNSYDLGEELKVNIEGNIDIDNMYLGYFDFDNFKKMYDKLKNNQLNITDFKDNHIKGNINVTDENVLFLSIPYNNNFKILVDGEKTDYYKVLDNFIGLDLEEGVHDIEIIYEVKGLKLGIVISIVSLGIFVLYVKKAKVKKI